ncbi:hypothetical protein PENANT_c026G05979 [Penicillium antarcticum]|uniref:Uncharacterized protein n=1 Tax=Penicillium antarcticum TaxID=416450 RepID=A0A1V6PX57_9EURO|nr:hypothetical protein PENANT_c026G05979 [Penicillium antarcticum]
MTDPRLIDMEPGGESTQYESIRQYTISPSKQTGQLGSQQHTKSEVSHPLGTDTPNSQQKEELQAQRLGMGVLKPSTALDEDDAEAKARRQQGYGPGSGVGA